MKMARHAMRIALLTDTMHVQGLVTNGEKECERGTGNVNKNKHHKLECVRNVIGGGVSRWKPKLIDCLNPSFYFQLKKD